MHDKARAHIARLVTNVFRKYDIKMLEWLAQSADHNLIEHAWVMLGRKAFSEIPHNLHTEEAFFHLFRE